MSLIPPGDLQDRRVRCRTEVQKLVELASETVSACNVCSSPRNVIISMADRYGFPARTALCLDCGLIYLLDRLTAESYAQFYSGHFRNVSSQFNKVTHALSQVTADQRDYAEKLSSVVGPYLSSFRRGTILDIGGSAGVVCSNLARKFEMAGTVLDPAADEVQVAMSLGINGIVGSVESYQTNEKYDLILLCRSIEHLMDLQKAFSRIRRLLKPGGLFYCDIADFMELCRLVGPPETVTKIDHCYWLTQSTALHIFESLGFELVSMNIVFGFGYGGYLLRPCEPKVAAGVPEERVQKLVEQIQQIQFEWAADASSSTLGHRLRLRAYRLKRKALRLAGWLDDDQTPRQTPPSLNHPTPWSQPSPEASSRLSRPAARSTIRTPDEAETYSAGARIERV